MHHFGGRSCRQRKVYTMYWCAVCCELVAVSGCVAACVAGEHSKLAGFFWAKAGAGDDVTMHVMWC